MANLVKKDFGMPREMAESVEHVSKDLGISQSEFIRTVIDTIIGENDASDTDFGVVPPPPTHKP